VPNASLYDASGTEVRFDAIRLLAHHHEFAEGALVEGHGHEVAVHAAAVWHDRNAAGRRERDDLDELRYASHPHDIGLPIDRAREVNHAGMSILYQPGRGLSVSAQPCFTCSRPTPASSSCIQKTIHTLSMNAYSCADSGY
jgi:hypothetical protein